MQNDNTKYKLESIFGWFYLIIVFIVFSYFLKREQFSLFYPLLLGCFYFFYRLIISNQGYSSLFVLGIILRVIMLFSLPELSDDFYRFLWDGALSSSGYNPFLYLPTEVVDQQLISPEYIALFPKLNSPNYYTVYPIIIQFIDYLAVTIGMTVKGSVIVLKLVFLSGELLTFWALKELLVMYNKDVRNVFWYWLCPLIVLEFVGNLHFECLMVTFMLLNILFFHKKKWLLSALFFALAVHVKLIPLLFFPVLFFTVPKPKKLIFFSWFSLFTILGLLPLLLGDGYLKVFQSVKLYFGVFEFNSSFYLVSRYLSWTHISFLWIIKSVGLVLMGSWILYSLRKKMDVTFSMAILYTIYLFFSQSIHPWYILPLLPIFILHEIPKYMWAWLLLIPLTYITYRILPYEQLLLVNIVEYGVVFGLFYWQRKELMD